MRLQGKRFSMRAAARQRQHREYGLLRQAETAKMRSFFRFDAAFLALLHKFIILSRKTASGSCQASEYQIK